MKIALPLALIALTSSTKAAPPTVDAENFSTLHALMQPADSELIWRRIPWQTNLWEARVAAAAAGKPIYLWEMDGHPLGCT